MRYCCRNLSILTLFAFALAGCEEPKSIVEPTAPSSTTASPDRAGPPTSVLQRSDIEADVAGPFLPGQPIHVNARVRSILPSSDVRITIRAPEIESARKTGWGPSFRPIIGEVFQPLSDLRTSAAQGSVVPISATLQVKAPGIYRVVVSAVAEGDPNFTEAGRPIQNVRHEELWLLVDEKGGGRHQHFDADLVPAGRLTQPGPFRTSRRRGEGKMEAQTELCSVQGQCMQTLHALYYDRDAAMNVPFPEARVTITYQDIETDYDQRHVVDEDEIRVFADGNGEVQWDEQCSDGVGGGWDRLVILMEARTPDAAVIGEYPTSVYSGYDNLGYGCGLGCDTYFYLPSDASHAAVNASLAAQGAESAFDTPIGTVVTVDLKDGDFDVDNSFYDKFQEHIEIIQPNLWGDQGRTSIAHEFGHAYHHKAIGGLDAVYPVDGNSLDLSCLEHSFYGTEDEDCALMEGYAHFISTLALDAAGSFSVREWYLDVGNPQSNGYQIEGSIAGFLYDAMDSANSESYDAVSLGPPAMFEIMKDCRRGNGGHITSISTLVYCMEKNAYGEWVYPNSGFPSDYGAIGSFPSQSQLHTLARKHLRNLN